MSGSTPLNSGNEGTAGTSNANVEHILQALEADDFDPVALINRQFPSERSLHGVEHVVKRLDGMVLEIEKEIKTAIYRQAGTIIVD